MFEDSSRRGFCAKKYIISAYKRIIHGGIVSRLFHENGISEFAGIPIRELPQNFVTSATGTLNGFKTYIENLLTNFNQRMNIPEYSILHRITHGNIWPNVANPAPIVPSRIIPPRPIGNYKGIGDSIGAASAAAANSAASRRLAKYSSM
ncbi:PREDICTED: uncharacterized protein LOC105150462 isoform X1 [Acromyrmex echinatior]|uniref:uncharacterized protein LOC105150462 isoform X1 n=1 Tax=Acromyrmex echinatior TaxID=103372 RepID=UPI000580C206|nr:PREDICTED: uncharacterized protein LOC105150462 isoform X1 [Acromyrmex echinatior]